MLLNGTPVWVWICFALMLLPLTALIIAVVYGLVRPGPVARYRAEGTRVELWVRPNRFPAAADVIVAPVAPDLRMPAGIAKWIRDATAGRAQEEARAAAPLAPGDALLVGGARYRFEHTALAVVMDDQKRVSDAWIVAAIRRGLSLAASKGATKAIVPDITDDLLRRPQTISDEERRTTCRPIAHAIVDAIIATHGEMDTIRVWVWQEALASVYREEMERLRDGSPQERSATVSA